MSIRQNFPTTQPSLVLDFANSKTLDPRITFSRTTTATRMNELGLIEVVDADEARFDHRYESGYVKSLGLLVEESRTNLIRYSIISTVAGWSISGSTVTNNATTAPDGTNTAARIQVDPGGYVADLSISVTAGQTYTFSFWVKSVSGSGTWGINIYDHGGANIGHHRTTVNITEEWQRVSYTYTPTGTLVNVYVSDDRDNLATISDAYVWGAQLEQGSFKTSLIPTEGSTVTRNPDNVSMIGENFSSWYNPSEGTLFFIGSNQYVSTTNGNTKGFVVINDSSSNTRIDFRQRIIFSILSSNGTNVSWSGISTPTNITDITDSSFQKVGMTYSSNSHAQAQNGYLTRTSTTPIEPINATRLAFFVRDSQTSPTGEVGGHISQLTYYPRRLTNSQLQNLTK